MSKTFNSKQIIEFHEKQIAIVESIQYFESMIGHNKRSIDGYGGHNFPDLVKKWNHKIEIYQMCIDRLLLRYRKNKKLYKL